MSKQRREFAGFLFAFACIFSLAVLLFTVAFVPWSGCAAGDFYVGGCEATAASRSTSACGAYNCTTYHLAVTIRDGVDQVDATFASKRCAAGLDAPSCGRNYAREVGDSFDCYLCRPGGDGCSPRVHPAFGELPSFFDKCPGMIAYLCIACAVGAAALVTGACWCFG